MKILVTYESKGGTTERFAQSIAAAARGSGDEVVVAPMRTVTPEQLKSADLVFAGTWVEGFVLFGVGPARAARRWLSRLPALSGKSVAVFCSFAFNPRGTLGSMRTAFQAQGAEVLGAQAFRRSEGMKSAEVFGHAVTAAAKERATAP